MRVDLLRRGRLDRLWSHLNLPQRGITNIYIQTHTQEYTLRHTFCTRWCSCLWQTASVTWPAVNPLRSCARRHCATDVACVVSKTFHRFLPSWCQGFFKESVCLRALWNIYITAVIERQTASQLFFPHLYLLLIKVNQYQRVSLTSSVYSGETIS